MSTRGPAILTTAFAVVLVALAGAYVVFRTYTPPTSASPPVTPEVRQFSLFLQSRELGEDTMHHWTPPVIVVNMGDTVILRVTNSDPENTHGFTLAAFGITANAIPSGETVTFRFQATRTGIYHYGCDLVGCATDHADQTGQLVVLGSP